MRGAIYARVSTSHQVEHQTIEQQFERLTAHVRTNGAAGWQLDPTHVFRDDGSSGATLARPGLDGLRDAIKNRAVDRVFVTAPDRLARNGVHQMVLLEEWARAGCAVAFLDRPMSDDPHDHLLLQIRGAVAESERTLIAERMRRGRLAKLRAGALLPWTYAPYGSRLSPDRPRDPAAVQIEPTEAAVVAELFALYREPGAFARAALVDPHDPRHPAQRRRDLEQRVRALSAQEEQLRDEAACRQHLAGVAASLEAFRACVRGGLAQADFEQRRQLVMLLIDRVVVTDVDVEIRYVLPTTPESEHVRFCQLRKDYFDAPVLAVATLIVADLSLAAALTGDDRRDALLPKVGAQPIGVVAFVCAQAADAA